MVDINRRLRSAAIALTLVTLPLASACGQPVSSSSSDTGPLTLRVGYLPNITHAPAIAGLNKGFIAASLDKDVTLEPHTFNAGPDEVTALLSGSIDVAFMGPNPATNAFVRSNGRAVRIVAGTTSGGALLVVKPSITSTDGLRGKTIADPQLGGTQDVALRWFLYQHNLHADTAGGGDVSVVPQDNSTTLTSFRQGQIDGAWVPEPWASRLVVEGGGHVLVDERDLWPQGRFVTTTLVVSTTFLNAHPTRLKALLEGVYSSVSYLNANPADAQSSVNSALAEITSKKLSSQVMAEAWGHMTFTLDPLASTLQTSAEHAHALALLPNVNLNGLYNLAPLNEVLEAHGQPAVQGL